MDMNKMMKQMQRMQADLAKAQEELALAVVTGAAGGGAVKIEFTGQEVSGVSIDPSVIDPEDAALLEDLIRTAFNAGLQAQQDLAAERLGPLTGGMNIPGLR